MVWGTRLLIFVAHAGIGVVSTFGVVAALGRRWKPAAGWFVLAGASFAVCAALSGLLAAVEASGAHGGVLLASDEKARRVAAAITAQTVWVNLGLAAGVVLGMLAERRKRA